GSSRLSSAEIYDPASGTWSLTGFMSTQGATWALLLPSGKVLVGHFSGGLPLSVEIFDPVAGTFQSRSLTFTSSGQTPNAAMLLADGKVLLVSGDINRIYDPVS